MHQKTSGRVGEGEGGRLLSPANVSDVLSETSWKMKANPTIILTEQKAFS